MPEYLAPGVYVEEVDTGDKPIEGVSTSTTGMVGVTARGPVNSPSLVTSVADFARQFGGRLDYHQYPSDHAIGGTSYLPLAVEGFFNNGGKRSYVVRVLPDAATYAAVELFDRGDTTTNWSTLLSTAAVKNEPIILVGSNPAIATGNWFVIEDGNASEYLQVSGAGLVSMRTPLVGDQAQNTPVAGFTIVDGATSHVVANPGSAAGATHVPVDATAGIVVDQLVRVGAASTEDLVAIKAIDTINNILTTYTPLAFPHSNPEAVVVQTTTAAGSTTLAQEGSPNDRFVVLSDLTQVATAAAIQFGVAPAGEWHLVAAMGLIQARWPVGFNHLPQAPLAHVTPTDADLGNPDRTMTADVPVGATELPLNDRHGLVAGQILRLGQAAPFEWIVIKDTGTAIPATAGPIELVAPVRRSYTQGTPGAVAHPFTDPNTADVNQTTLLRAAHPGDRALLIADHAAAFTTGNIVRIESATSNAREYQTLVAPTTSLVVLVSRLAASHDSLSTVAGRAQIATVHAIDRGSWGNCLRVMVDDDDPILDTAPTTFPGVGLGAVQLGSTVGIEPGSILEFYSGSGTTFTHEFYQKVDSVSALTKTVNFVPPGLVADVKPTMRVRTREFKMTVECLQLNPRTQKPQLVPGMSETLRQLSMDGRHSRYFVRVIGAIPAVNDVRTDGESMLARVKDELTLVQSEADTSIRLSPDNLPADPSQQSNAAAQRFSRWLTGGDDAVGQIDDTTYIGADALDPAQRTGLFALKNIEAVSIVGIPGRVSEDVQSALIDHCELLRYRFSVLDCRDGQTMDKVQEQRNLYDTKYAAIYYPWLEIADPFPANPRVPSTISIPPSGHMMGIYARSDIERGVHKAPANEVIRGIDDLQFHLFKEQQDILNPRNVNALRDFRDHGRGLRVWGARCITSDPDWKYVNVRRLFIFLEASIDRGTQWVVFEPNDYRLWARVTQSVTAFLTSVWRNGALMGKTPEQAFFVKCDVTTMTQDDIDNGRLIMVIGVAPVKPAEFVIIRIGQWAGGSFVQEG